MVKGDEQTLDERIQCIPPSRTVNLMCLNIKWFKYFCQEKTFAPYAPQNELIALSAITCSAKLCETCQKNFPPFFDVKIEEIML
jgi:hypothetical protein